MCKERGDLIVKFSSLALLLALLFEGNLFAQTNFHLYEASSGLPHIYGEPKNADYLYVTAGNSLYCIGNQAGEFPEVGFHIPGQMGGIWQQPLKLLDGFSLSVKNSENGLLYSSVCDSFITYSFATKFHFSVPGHSISITQTQFVPDNLPVLVVEYQVQNTSEQDQDLALELNTYINLMPVWLGERIGMMDHSDTLALIDTDHSVMYYRDQVNSWYAGIGFENNGVQLRELQKTPFKDKGITGVSLLQCHIPAGKSFEFRFYVSGSLSGTGEIEKNISVARSQLSQLFNDKKKRYHSIEETAEIAVPDKLLETAYAWGKYNTDWLLRDVPAMGEGLSAGLPDYPWFFSNDQAATFMALTGIVQPDLFYKSFSMLKRISDSVNNNSGRIIHEVSSNGVVYDKGRMEESQLHIIAAWQIFKWTGNIPFLKENYDFAKKTWNWSQQHLDQNGYIVGSGGTEIEGLDDVMLDVQLNNYRFMLVLSQMAAIFNEKDQAEMFRRKAEKRKLQINRDWWIESENRYADFITTKEKALGIINDALAKRCSKGRNEWALGKLTRLRAAVAGNTYPGNAYVVYYNPSGLQPMEDGLADSARSMKMLKNASFFTNKFGIYITGIDRPDDVKADERNFRKDTSFSYSRAVMPAATAGLALAAARLGMPDTALMFIHKTLNSFSYATPGTTYEISPDYGMFVQAWNISGVNIPLIQSFFGVEPDAYRKEIAIHLQMPTNWENASLKNLLIGSTRLTMEYKKKDNRISCVINCSEPGWKIHFIPDAKATKILVNQMPKRGNEPIAELGGTRNTIEYDLN